MFNRDRKKQLKKAYDDGYKKATEEKNNQIKKIRNQHADVLKNKNNKILKLKKQVQKVERTMEEYSGIFRNLRLILETISSNSYIKTMSQNDEHRKVELALDETYRLSRRFDKADTDITTKVLEFKKLHNG